VRGAQAVNEEEYWDWDGAQQDFEAANDGWDEGEDQEVSTEKLLKVNAASEQLDTLLQALELEGDFDDEEKKLLLFAFTCPVCDTPTAACTTTSDQIRAVHDAFRLIDADGDMVVTLTDLRDIKTWTNDHRRQPYFTRGAGFLDKLVGEVEFVVYTRQLREIRQKEREEREQEQREREQELGSNSVSSDSPASPAEGDVHSPASRAAAGEEAGSLFGSGSEYSEWMQLDRDTFDIAPGTVDDEAPVSCKEFMLAFAHCLGYGAQDGVAEVLEKRASEYRVIGKLFGMEKVEPTFQYNKFWLSFMSTGFAFMSLPLMTIDLLTYERRMAQFKRNEEKLDRIAAANRDRATVDQVKREAREKLRRLEAMQSMYDVLRRSQWLPHPFTTYDALQRYLMAQWVPCIIALVLYFVFQDSMVHISLMEVIYPLVIYVAIGMYLATISGYEHPKLQVK